MGALGCQFPQALNPRPELAAEEALMGAPGCQFPATTPHPAELAAQRRHTMHNAANSRPRSQSAKPMPPPTATVAPVR